MITSPRAHLKSSSTWHRAGLGLVALALGGLGLTATAQTAEEKTEKPFIAIRAADTDSLNISTDGQATLSLTRAPTRADNAKLHIVNSAAFALWTGDLKAQGNRWVAQLDRNAVEALLVANAIHAEFPGKATGGKDLRISLLRDNFNDSLAPTHALLGSDPLFYKAPEAPEPLEAIDPGVDAIRVSSYAMAARRYDEQLSAYQQRLLAAKSNASALWTDLRTAGRLPDWPASVTAAQQQAFDAIQTKVDAVAAQRMAARAQAREIVEKWNSANGEAEAISLEFSEIG